MFIIMRYNNLIPRAIPQESILSDHAPVRADFGFRKFLTVNKISIIRRITKLCKLQM